MPIKTRPRILLINFMFLGDIVFLTPSIQALKFKFPKSKIDVLIPREASPLLINHPDINKVWGFPRKRGKINFIESLFFILNLRKTKFDFSVDFIGNDRGSIISRLISANLKFGVAGDNSTFFQSMNYNIKILSSNFPSSYTLRNIKIIEHVFNLNLYSVPKMKIFVDSKLRKNAIKIFNRKNFILCHISTTQDKKKWPIFHWIKLNNLARSYGIEIFFSAGPSLPEQNELRFLKYLDPTINLIEPILDLNIFLLILNESKLVIANDTGPLHFSYALGKKVIGLFGTADSIKKASSIYKKNEKMIAKECLCIGEKVMDHFCHNNNFCMNSITPEAVFNLLLTKLPLRR